MRRFLRNVIRKRTRVCILRISFLSATAAAMAGGVYALARFPRVREFAVILLVSAVLAIWLQIMEERSDGGEEV